MVWPHLKILWHGEDSSAEDRKRARKGGRQKKRCVDNNKEWTGMKIPCGQRKTVKGGKVQLRSKSYNPT